MMNMLIFPLAALLQFANLAAASTSCAVTVAQEPVILRISKDEFRIAFGVNGEACQQSGCTGFIQYQATWRTDDGYTNVDRKQLSFAIPSGASRTVAVDRSYFDTGEGKHTTDIVSVSVDSVNCSSAVAER